MGVVAPGEREKKNKVQLLLKALSSTPPLNSGLMNVLSEPGQFSAFGNSLPSFFNHEWKTEKRHECANMGKVKRLEL